MIAFRIENFYLWILFEKRIINSSLQNVFDAVTLRIRYKNECKFRTCILI